MRRFSVVFLLAFCVFGGRPARADLDDHVWQEIRSEHFRIFTNGDVDVVRDLAGDLENFRRIFMLMTGKTNVDSPVPFTIIAVVNRNEFDEFFAQPFVAGVFGGNLLGSHAVIDLSTRRPDRNGKPVLAADLIIKHEYVHFLLRTTSRIRYPLWYEEGFAEFLSTAEYDHGDVMVGMPVVDRHISLSSDFGLSSMDHLLASTHADRQVRTDILYAQGWLLVHHLMTTPDLLAKFVDYLKRFDETGDSVASFRAVYGDKTDEIQHDLVREARRGRYHYITLTPKTPFPEPKVSVHPVSQTEIRLQIAEALPVFGRDDERLQKVRELYERVLAGEPDNARAIAGLAHLLLRKGDLDAAAAMLARLPEQTEDESALTARGDLALAQAVWRALDPSLLQRARECYMAVLRRNNQSAEAFFSYGLTYLGSDENPKEGLLAFDQATYLVPGDLDAAMFYGLLQLQAGHFAEATKLERHVVVAGTPSSVAIARQVLALAGQRDAAGGRELAGSVLALQVAGRFEGPEGD
ncbi:MAG: tetratricopeptide repeat protein [Alphaproteobacteria bacterium]|nr:tetratricopeptide repeat protein [Alphaproteobacteria bacterium]